MRYWVKIEHAAKKENHCIIGIVCVNNVVISSAFPSFWVTESQEYLGMPTHYIDMPEFRPDEEW